MSEYEILNLYAAATADQTAVIGLLISLHFAIIVAIFYFLHRSGLAMKSAVMVFYSLAYAMLIGITLNQSAIVYGASRDLIALTEAGQRLSGAGHAALQQASDESFVNVVATVSLISLWFGTAGFLFFWKRPKDAQ